MTVKRIVANIEVEKVSLAKKFYHDLLGLDEIMNMQWIATYGTSQKMTVQISFATEGGSGTPVPDLSIEVDNLDDIYKQAQKMKYKIEYELTEEPWGVRRFFVRDPFGKLINILSHN